MPRKGSKVPYKPKKEYTYTLQDVADLAGITRNALNVAKVHGKIDPDDFRSVVTFLTKRIIDRRLSGDLFTAASPTKKRVKGMKTAHRKIKKSNGRNK
ncbi:MAG: hypothetical protein ABSA46_12315 [Thermodesulfovibrionales bacterium]|jgi:hypothetical protein